MRGVSGSDKFCPITRIMSADGRTNLYRVPSVPFSSNTLQISKGSLLGTTPTSTRCRKIAVLMLRGSTNRMDPPGPSTPTYVPRSTALLVAKRPNSVIERPSVPTGIFWALDTPPIVVEGCNRNLLALPTAGCPFHAFRCLLTESPSFWRAVNLVEPDALHPPRHCIPLVPMHSGRRFEATPWARIPPVPGDVLARSA